MKLICREIFILVPPSFSKGQNSIQTCSLEKPLFTKADVCIPVSSICVYIGDEKIPLGWEYADLLNQTDWWNWSWTIKLEFSNLIDYLSCTSTIQYWIKNGRKLKFISFPLVNFFSKISISIRSSRHGRKPFWRKAYYKLDLFILWYFALFAHKRLH